MIIDSHAHIGTGIHINTSIEQLLHSMDEAKIDKALVYASRFASTNEETLKAIKSHRDRLLPVACAQLTWDHKLPEDIDEFVAVKFYTGYEHYYPNDERVIRLCKHLQAAKKPAIFHIGDCLNTYGSARVKYAQPLALDDVAAECPDLKIVIAHMGWPFVRETAYLCWKYPNLYTDVSGFTYGEFKQQEQGQLRQALREIVETASEYKLLWGTDFPISSQKSYVEVFRDVAIGGIPLTPEKLSEHTQLVFRL